MMRSSFLFFSFFVCANDLLSSFFFFLEVDKHFFFARLHSIAMLLLRSAAAVAARAMRASHSMGSSALPLSLTIARSPAIVTREGLRGGWALGSKAFSPPSSSSPSMALFSSSLSSSASAAFSFRRSHLDFPRRETLFQRLFLGRNGGRGGTGSSSNNSNPDAVLVGLIAANVGVYCLWHVAPDPALARRHLVVSASALSEGRVHTLITSAFSHREGTTHLLVNMVSLYFFGKGVGRALGGRALLTLYLAAGAGGALAHCAASVWPCYSDKNMPEQYRRACVRAAPGALGASAAVNGVVALSCLLWPTSTVLLWGVVPVPAFALGAAFLLQDVVGAWRDVEGGGGGGRGGGRYGGGGGVAHAGHLGGAAVGALAWAALRRGRGIARW